jgi:hypothetical protein
LHKIFSLVNEIRYSDETNVTFLHAKLNGIHYWNAVSQKEFLDTSNGLSTPVEVVYVSGPLSGAKHYIEANGRFHWGHRNNYAVTRGKLSVIIKSLQENVSTFISFLLFPHTGLDCSSMKLANMYVGRMFSKGLRTDRLQATIAVLQPLSVRLLALPTIFRLLLVVMGPSNLESGCARCSSTERFYPMNFSVVRYSSY